MKKEFSSEAICQIYGLNCHRIWRTDTWDMKDWYSRPNIQAIDYIFIT
jgi:hypothetical protein